VAIFFVTL